MDLMVSRLDWAKKMGATHTLNPQESDVVKIVNQITQGRGVDVVIEITGTLSGLSLACDIIRVGRGKLLTPSLYDSPEIFDFGYQLMLKSPIVHSTHPWYSADYQEDMRKGVEGFVRRMLPLDQIITHEFSLENINDGFEMLENPTEDFIKGIVVP